MYFGVWKYMIVGTTRDVVEVKMDLEGVPCTGNYWRIIHFFTWIHYIIHTWIELIQTLVSDTAGLRDEKDVDVIEQEGMRRTKEELDRSYSTLYMCITSFIKLLYVSIRNINKVWRATIPSWLLGPWVNQWMCRYTHQAEDSEMGYISFE